MGALMNALTQPWPTQAQPVADVRKPMPLETGSGAGAASSVYVPRGYGERLPEQPTPKVGLGDVLPRGPQPRQLDRPIHPSVLEEMRSQPEPPPPTLGTRPVHESTIREMMEAEGRNPLAPPKSPMD